MNWLLNLLGDMLERIGDLTIRLAVRLFRMLGWLIVYSSRRAGRGALRLCFGNFTRALVTFVVFILMVGHHFPEVKPMVVQLLGIMVAIFGICVILKPLWSTKKRK